MRPGAVYVNTARAVAARPGRAHRGARGRGTWPRPASTTSRARTSPSTTRWSRMPNVVLTPHIGGATYDTETNHTMLMATGLAALLAGDTPSNLANPEVLDHG